MLQIFRNRSALTPVTPESRPVPSKPEFMRLIDRERERANRNRHCVSLVLIRVVESQMPAGSQPIDRIISTIQNRIRTVDEVGWYDDRRLGILLPYTNRTGAYRVSTDIVEQLKHTPIQFVTEIFTFPADGPGDSAHE